MEKARNIYIHGRNAVIEALSKENPEIEKIYISYSAKGGAITKITKLAKKKKIQCARQDKRKFNRLEKEELPKNSKSQGVIALMRLFKLVSLEELIKIAYDKEKNPVIIALDEINDPHNLGAIARTSECAGAAGALISERKSAPITSAALKTSAGALEHLPIAKESSFPQALQKLKDEGFWIIGTDDKAEQYYYDFDFARPTVLIIGSEGKGMRPSTKKLSDISLKIPTLGKIPSLNASVSAGVILYEIAKRKMKE